MQAGVERLVDLVAREYKVAELVVVGRYVHVGYGIQGLIQQRSDLLLSQHGALGLGERGPPTSSRMMVRSPS